ncbi:type VI secretion system contractile sheath large subunit [Bradyrhizobium mercantei]|uniref:type VI secretion system contractile sheath large subunit n=1 Tax=Bradyrhizobium mercantei TaxID=1904807 RepID=UPI0009F9554B|nr:type VI secretion system contractile sheath large subunit [Bradyrhizobium mercantei]
MTDTSAQSSAEVVASATDVSLLDQILVETKITPQDEGYDLARRGVAAFVTELIKPNRASEQVNNALIDRMIAEIDRKISAQLDAVLHTDEFQQLESAWRGLKFMVDRTDFRQNIKVEILSVSKDELLTDFEDSPEIVKSGLYKHVYSAEFGQFGGQPIAAMISAYEFGSGSQDVKLMRYMSATAAMAHAPVIASAEPDMFGVERHEEIASLKDLQSIFEGPKYVKWNSFRESEDARYLGLTLPRFLLRLPYGPETVPVKAFNYQEASDGDTNNYLWGNAAFAFATRLTESFAKYRWCPNIIGPQSGGAVENLNLHTYEAMGQLQSKVPTEVLISDRREFELAEQGFIALTMRKGSDNAAFFSANSVQRPKYFGNTQDGKTAELNYKLGTQLPYTALPDWAQTLGMTFSIMLWMPSWGGMINGLMTLSGAWDKLRTDPVLRMMVVSVAFYGMSTFEGPMMSIKVVNSLSHYTDWTIGHVHSGALGWVGFVSFGALYCLVPWLWNRQLYSLKLANWHFWISTIGIVLYISAMWVSGILQGLMWRAYTSLGFLEYSFIESVEAMHPFYIIRAAGGALFLIGALIMAVNLWMTVNASKASETEGAGALQPAE